MAYLFFYVSTLVVWVLLFAVLRFKSLSRANILVGIVTALISLLYDLLLGENFKLYYYISPQYSVYYIIVSALLIYPLLNIIYTLFLPRKLKSVFLYTVGWIAAMLLFEYASVALGTIVFTGWKPIPWSIATYIFTYLWVYFLYKRSTKELSFKV